MVQVHQMEYQDLLYLLDQIICGEKVMEIVGKYMKKEDISFI